jgi:hypothetical protein
MQPTDAHLFLPIELEPLQRFRSVDAFYADDERRRRSPEWDYGVAWRSSADELWPRWRVSWVVATGDVYAVKIARDPLVLLLGVVPPLGEYPYGEGSAAWHDFARVQPVERVLAGWAELDEQVLGWVVERIAAEGFDT